jgi:hypothetical protein
MTKKRKDVLFLLFVSCCGLALRFFFTSQNLGWWDDVSRDFMVGYHIFHYGERIVVGHFCSGLGHFLYYPPYYFYFVSLLVGIARTPLFTTLLFSTINAIAGIVFYFITKEVLDEKAAKLALIFFAFSYNLVLASSAILSVYLSVSLNLFGTLLFVKGIKKNNFWLTLLSLGVLIFFSTVFYGSLPLILIYLIILTLHFKKDIRKVLGAWLFTPVFLLILNIPLFFFFPAKALIIDFFSSDNLNLHKNFMISIQSVLYSFYESFFHRQSLGVVLFFLLLLLMIFKKSSDLKKIGLPFAIIAVYFFLAIIKNGSFFDHYLLLTYPVYLFLLSHCLSALLKIGKSKIWLILFFCLCLFFFIENTDDFLYFSSTRNITYSTTQAFVDYLIPQIPNLNSFDILISTEGNPKTNTTEAAYFIEQRLGKKYDVVDAHSNIMSMVRSPQNYIIICQRSNYFGGTTTCQETIESFSNLYPNFQLEKTLEYKGLYTSYVFTQVPYNKKIDLRTFPY